MTLATLRRITMLVEQVATVIGDALTGSPTLCDGAAAYRALIGQLWGGRTMGKGRVVAGQDINAALACIAPDFTYAKAQPKGDIAFVHRVAGDGDVYFVSNRRDRTERTEARFRVTGKMPQLRHADTGRATAVSYRIDEGADHHSPRRYRGRGGVRRLSQARHRKRRHCPGAVGSTVARVDGPWTVTFQPARGAPATLRLPTLAPL